MNDNIRLNFVDDEQLIESDSDDEGIVNYKIGGYHPVFIGEVFHNRYVIIQKLGWGHFSTVWLAKDIKNTQFVALKIQKSAPHYLEAAFDEVEILQSIQKKSTTINIVKLLNAFIHQGPFGNHFVMIFEILGVNLLEILKKYEQQYKGLSIEQCKSIIRQILIAVDFLHRECGIIHTDLKPENILVCLTAEQIKEIVETGQITQRQKYSDRVKSYQAEHKVSRQEKKKEKKKRNKEKLKLEQAKCKSTFVDLERRIFQVKIADLGNGCWVHHHFSETIQTPKYRAPEVIIGASYGTSADIWSIACIAFELMTGDSLFECEADGYPHSSDNHLAQMQELLGPFPKEMTCVGKLCKQLFKNGRLRYVPEYEEYSLLRLLTEKYQMAKRDAIEFSEFLLPMLQPLPYGRSSACQMLRHPWLCRQSVIRSTLFHYDSSENAYDSGSDDDDIPIEYTGVQTVGHGGGIKLSELDVEPTFN